MNSIAASYSDAVSRVVDLIDCNETPVSAIAKVACADNLTDAQVYRLCQLHNRAQQLGERIGEPKASTKFAAVPGVVDPDIVLSLVHKRRNGMHVNAKTAALSGMPADMLETTAIGLQSNSVSKKGCLPPSPVVTEVFDRHAGLYDGMSRSDATCFLRESADKLAGLYHDIRKSVSAADGAISNSVNMVCDAVIRHRNVDDRVNCVKLACFALSNAGIASLYIGNRIDKVLDEIPSHKHASFGPLEPPAVHTVEYLKFASMATELSALFDDLRTTLSSKSAACAETRERIMLVKSCLTNDGVVNREYIVGKGSLADRQSEHISKLASFFSSFIGGRLSGQPMAAQNASTQAAERFKLALGNPQHEAALLSIRSRAALQQLLKDDPIISREDPNNVATAFNELAAYTPNAMSSQAVLRSALRQYLMNNTSAADLTAIRGLERGQGSKPQVA